MGARPPGENRESATWRSISRLDLTSQSVCAEIDISRGSAPDLRDAHVSRAHGEIAHASTTSVPGAHDLEQRVPNRGPVPIATWDCNFRGRPEPLGLAGASRVTKSHGSCLAVAGIRVLWACALDLLARRRGALAGCRGSRCGDMNFNCNLMIN